MSDVASQRACRPSRTLPLRSSGQPATAGQARPAQAKPAPKAGHARPGPDTASRDFPNRAAPFGGNSGDSLPRHRGTTDPREIERRAIAALYEDLGLTDERPLDRVLDELVEAWT